MSLQNSNIKQMKKIFSANTGSDLGQPLQTVKYEHVVIPVWKTGTSMKLKVKIYTITAVTKCTYIYHPI